MRRKPAAATFRPRRAVGPQRPGSPPGRWALRMRPAAGTSHSRSAAGTERPSAARARHNDQGIAGTGPADILPNSLTLPLLRPSVCSSTSRSRSRRRRAASHCATLRFASAARLELCCWRRSPGLLSASRCPDLPPRVSPLHPLLSHRPRGALSRRFSGKCPSAGILYIHTVPALRPQTPHHAPPTAGVFNA